MKVGVIGGGSWGTSLANLAGRKGHAVDLWVYELEVKKQIRSHHENRTFLPGVTLSANMNATNDIAKAVYQKDLVLVVVPSHVMRMTTAQFSDHLSPDTILVSASKGIENDTHLTMTGVMGETVAVSVTGSDRCAFRAEFCPGGKQGSPDSRNRCIQKSRHGRAYSTCFCDAIFPYLYHRRCDRVWNWVAP